MYEQIIQVLLVEDNPTDAFLVREALGESRSIRFALTHVERLQQGEALAAERAFEVVLVDLSLPDAQGLQTVRRMHAAAPDAALVVLTGLDDEQTALDAAREGAQDYLIKNQISGNLLARAIRYAMERKRADEAVHERERRERALLDLQKSEQHYRELAETLPQLVWTSQPSGNFDYLSSQWIEYTGLPEAQQLGLHWVDRVLHPEDRERTLACWTAALEQRAPFDLELRLHRKDGIWRWFKARGVPILDGAGRIVKWFGTCTDIEDQKCAEAKLIEQARQLASANAALADADRRKDEFLAMLAHELRNPLAPILNAVHLLRLIDPDNETIRKQREVIERQVSHMARLLDDLLDVSRITSGKIHLHKERLDLLGALDHCLELTRPLVARRSHKLLYERPPGALWIEADAARIEQILINLLLNAVKYTEPGGRIGIEVTREAPEADVALAVVRVRDSGIGISPEMLPHVFDLFSQADQSLDRSQGGLGVGLTMVHRLVELHGGKVQALSEGSGKGSEFVMRLPLAGEGPETAAPNTTAKSRVTEGRAADDWREARPMQAAEPEAGAICRILVVDDNIDSATSLGDLLGIWGHEVRLAHDGPGALEKILSWRPDMVLLDIGLPGLDGYEVARRVRAQLGPDSMMLVAVTGYGQQEDRRLAKEAGFDRHFIKPVNIQDLEQLIATSCAARAGRS